MKKILLLTICLISLTVFGQFNPDFDSRSVKKFIDPNPGKHLKRNSNQILNSRAYTESYFLNSAFFNQPTARDNNAGPFVVTFGRLNRKWENTKSGTMRDLLQYIGNDGSIYHIFGLQNNKYVYNTINLSKTTLRIDSVEVPFYYDRKVNTTDSIIISLYDLSDITIPNNQTNNGTPVSISYNADPLYRFATAVTAPIATTDTFNFTTPYPFTNYLVKPNLTLPAGKAFALRVEFDGDTANYFHPIFDMYDECSSGCVASRAYTPNTTGYLNYTFNSNPPFNFSGAMNRQSMFACQNPLDDCSWYYYQSYRANYYVTSTTDFNVNIDPVADIRGCSGTTLRLASSYSGLDTIHKVSLLWKASRGTFENGKDTITSTGPTYGFDTTGGLHTIILKGTATNGEIASDTILLANWSMNPNLTVTGKISCDPRDSVRMSIPNTASVGMNSSMVTAYDNITTLSLATNLNHLNQFFGLRYEWTGVGLYPRTDTTFTNTKTAGTFNLKITNSIGCSKTVSRTFTNSANPPLLDFTFNPSSSICINRNITFTVSNSAIRAGWNYTWTESSFPANTVGETTVQKFTTPGVKSVKLNADSSGCKATEVSKNLTVISTNPPCNVSISSVLNENIQIFPNPVRDGKLFVKNDYNQSYTYRVTDMLGKIIASDKLGSQKDGQIDLSNTPNGVYFIELESKGDRIIKKIIVDKY